MNRLCAGVLALGLLVACGDDDSASTEPTERESADDSTTTTEEPTTTTEAPSAAEEYVLTDEDPPPFVLLGAEPQFIKGYVMPNGRILWVDETSGIGRIIANPDEVLADQAECEYLFGMDTDEWFDWADGIPNFEGPVCHPYSVNDDL